VSTLEVRGLVKEYRLRNGLRGRRLRAVDDVSFALERGRTVALVGQSGSGKSTIARLLLQLERPDGGEIRLDGKPVARRGAGLAAYRRTVQMVFQDPFASLNPHHSVRHHLERPVRLHHPGMPTAQVRERVHELLERVRLTPADNVAARRPHELSGGQRQRVAIARALAPEPGILIADEPVSMLDVSIRLGVLNLLRDLKERLNLAILYITHDIASARYFADDTMVMYAGRMVEGGDSESVTQSPAHPYTRLLIDSAPDPDRIANLLGDAADRGNGEPPSLIRPPSGCRFHPRCPMAMPRCSTDLPVRLEIGDRPGHWAACWLYDEATVAAQPPGSAAAGHSPEAVAVAADAHPEEVR
jgi:peptide/nickel transport system ATP-binding protein